MAFVDCHSHVVPSGDDGAQNLTDGLELCRLAHRSGTEVLYATPHVWPHLLLGPERERRILAAFAELRESAPLELRLGYELTPTPELLDEDPRRYVLEGTEVVLVEAPAPDEPERGDEDDWIVSLLAPSEGEPSAQPAPLAL